MEYQNRLSAKQLRELLHTENSRCRTWIHRLFDERTFMETGAYVRRADTEGNSFESVVTGHGAIADRLVFALIQDSSRSKGVMSEVSAGKIETVIDQALKNGAPLIAVFDSVGARILEGASVLSGYGKIMRKLREAAGEIPRIAIIDGLCAGASAVLAAQFDFVIGIKERGALYITPSFMLPEQDVKPGSMEQAATLGLTDILCKDMEEAIATVHRLLDYLPSDATGYAPLIGDDDLNRLTPEVETLTAQNGYDMHQLLDAIADHGSVLELSAQHAPEMLIGLLRIGGVSTGFVANNPAVRDGALTPLAAKKAADFIRFCDAFDLPLLTLTDTCGFDHTAESEYAPYSAALAELADSYADADNPRVNVIVGRAYGTAFALMGTKELGADVVLALDSAKIGAMAPESAVQFLSFEEIRNDADPAAKRQELLEKWNEQLNTPLEAARCAALDDIVAAEELRQRIASSFSMLDFSK